MSTRSNNRTYQPETAVMVALEALDKDMEGVTSIISDDDKVERSRRLAQEIKGWLDPTSKTITYSEIDELYDKVSVELEHFANLKIETKEREIEYLRLNMIREGLIQSALSLDIEQLEDIRDRLKLWYKIVVSESTEDDLLVSDQFIISIHKYLSSVTSLSSS